jgi:phosphoribosyl-AMP cyclohydrolase / phosphoribosyl-ATP pyrophosphohydrolase
MMIPISEIKFDEHGLVPVVVQDHNTLQVLTVAFMNAESLKQTLETEETWFWSRSRSMLWHKGETSGNTQRVVEISLDCDHDALKVLVEPAGPACHTGARSCFHNELQETRRTSDGGKRDHIGLAEILDELYALLETRKRDRPEGSYSSYLFEQGLDKILKKVGEESAETIIAAKNQDDTALIKETSDLLYHLMVLLVERGMPLQKVAEELRDRREKSGK